MECKRDNTLKENWINAQGQHLAGKTINFIFINQDEQKPFVFEVQLFYYKEQEYNAMLNILGLCPW